jgi:hypothetical protein
MIRDDAKDEGADEVADELKIALPVLPLLKLSSIELLFLRPAALTIPPVPRLMRSVLRMGTWVTSMVMCCCAETARL